MGTYQGPHVEVTQRFQTNAPALAIESLPSNAIATAYDVFKKEVLGEVFGIIDKLVPWGVENVLFDESVSGKRAYDFYPVKIFGDTAFGDQELEDIVKDEDNVTIPIDQTFTVPRTEKTNSGFLPYYRKITAVAETVTILATDLKKVLIAGGAVVSNRIKVGQKVFISSNGGSAWTYVGTVGALSSSENEITLATPYSAEIDDGNSIVIGADSADTIGLVNTLYDSNANFEFTRVQRGDILEFSSKAVEGSDETPIKATITGVFKNRLVFNTEIMDDGQVDYDMLKYKPGYDDDLPTPTTLGTVDLSSYKVTRPLGFSENYGLKLLHTGPKGIVITKSTVTSFSYAQATNPKLEVGDFFAVTAPGDAPGAAVNERELSNLKLYKVLNVIEEAPNYVVTTDEAILRSVHEAAYATSDILIAWHPLITSDVKANFRSIRTQELGVVKRISSIDDIVAAYCKDTVIDVHNELAYMLQAIYSRSGGKVCYGVHVSSGSGLLTSYTDAMDALKMFDVYSTCLGTTDAGVNGVIGDYVDQQSAPYEAHERISILTYDEIDIYKMGSDLAESDAGVLTISGSFNPITAGLTIGDKVEITDKDGLYLGSFSIIETPGIPTEIATDYDGENLEAGARVVFMCGRKDAQAVRISSIKYGNRRIKVLWPSYFIGDFENETLTLPPYYIAAARCGMDGGVVVSQSCTNYSFALPGISNIQLGTNSYFRKEQLDEIGGGGVDITIQDAFLSQTIKSRHDLTSNMDAVEYREWSITKQADVAAKTYRTAVSPYVGKYNITDDLLRFLSTVVNIATSVLIKQTIVKSAELDSVARDELVVDKINIVITITVFIAGNYFDITLNVKSK